VRTRKLPVPFLLIAAMLLVAAGPAQAKPKNPPAAGKNFTVQVSSAYAGDTVHAGDATTFTVVLTNRTGTQQLGSANVTVAPGIGIRPGASATVANDQGTAPGTATFSATDPRTLELRGLDLAPDRTATVTFDALAMPCTGTPTWPAPTAKQSNDYSGAGNDLTFQDSGSDLTTDLSGQCTLDFLVNPAGAQTSAPIRGTAYEPTSAPVQLRALGANGLDPVPSFSGPVTLGLETSAAGSLNAGPAPSLSDGVLSYSGLTVNAAGSYKLTASKAGYIGTKSPEFPISDEVGSCDANGCGAPLTSNGTRATVKLEGSPASSGSGHVALSSSIGTRPDCTGYTSPMGANEWYEFAATTPVEKRLTVTFTKAAMKTVMGGANSLEICFSSPEAFVPKGALTPYNYVDDLFDFDPFDGFVGLLADCPATPGEQPCILGRSPAGGGAVVSVFAPASLGDPRMH
jgi:hypothetical protein